MSLHDAVMKIRREHTEKLAYVYVRQSTPGGVKKNVAGGERQRSVRELAIQIGWPEANVRVIDEDQGQTGTSTEGRYGYTQMLNDVVDYQVGAVFSSESARVGRDSADWHILIKMCDLTGTLVIDLDGIYDASDPNDNTVMKLKALMTEMELRWITSRLLGAKRILAAKGELRYFLPAGYVYDEDKKIVFDPSEDVQKAVRLVFTLFRQLGSATRVVAHFNNNKLTFPTVVRGGPRKGQYEWKRLDTGRVQNILHNPIYAGTYVYGRSKTKRKAVRKEGEAPKAVKYQEKLKREEWQYVFHGTHPAYITWAEFVENERQLVNNRNAPGGRAPRAGSALLHGLILCGKCGQAMHVSYPHSPAIPYYTCIYERVRFAGRSCQSMAGDLIDRAVERAFLDALRPAQVEMTLDALRKAEAQASETNRQWGLRLKRAEAAVADAEERLLATDPKNKRAYGRVQVHLETKEDELDCLRRERVEQQAFVLEDLSPDECNEMLAFARDFPRIWRAETTDMVAKKTLLRCLVSDVTLRRDGTKVFVGIRWKTEAQTALIVELYGRRSRRRLPKPLLDFIEDLAPTHTDRQIALALNDAGMVNGRGKSFTRKRIKRIREKYEIRKHPLDDFPEVGEEGRYSTAAVADMLNVHINTVIKWCREGSLDGVKDRLENRWWIKATPEELAEVEKTIRRQPNRLNKSGTSKQINPPAANLHELGLGPKGVAL